MMADIDIGSAATNRGSILASGTTYMDKNNPANDTGTITTVKVYANSNVEGLKVGTFFGSGTTYENRDYVTIGSVTAGSVQTFTGLSINVEAGDFIGVFHSSGNIERDTSGYSDIYYYNWGDVMGLGEKTFVRVAGDAFSVYGEGDLPSGTNMTIGVDDAYKEVATVYVNVDDAWKTVANAYCNVDDVWKTIF